MYKLFIFGITILTIFFTVVLKLADRCLERKEVEKSGK